MANKNRMEWTINPEIDSISGYSGFEEELQFNSTVLGEINASAGNPGGNGRRRTRLDSEASFQKRRRLLAEGIVDESVWCVDDTAEFPQGFKENVPPSGSNGDSSSKSNENSVNINANEESALEETVVQEEDLFSSDLDVGNGDLDLGESSYSRFTLGVPSTSTFIREPFQMEDTLQEDTPTAPRRVLRSRNPPTKITTTDQPTEESQSEDSDSTSSEESCDEEEPPNPPRIALKPQNERAFTCTNCPMQFKSKQGKQLHEYKKHMTPEELKENSISHWECPHCSEICVLKSHYDAHLLTHNGIKPHNCSLCLQKFARKGHLNRHVKTVHLKQMDFKCSKCQQKFGLKENLDRHVNEVHLTQTDFNCSKCQQKFGRKENLNVHMKTVHLKQRDFKCTETECNYKSGLKANLKIHVAAIHNGIKYECPNCKQKLSPNYLTKHKRNCLK